MSRPRLLAPAAVVVAIAAHALAQATHVPSYPLNGTVPDGAFGFSVSGAGDVNNDGYDDFIIGARLDNTVEHGAGAAFVYSGYDGALLHTLYGQSFSEEFGTSVSGAGDVNNDGFADLIIGAPKTSTFNHKLAGMARVISGADAAVFFTVYGAGNFELLGQSVSAAGDINNDGFDDVIIGIPGALDGKGNPVGSARVYFGPDGGSQTTFFGDPAGNSINVIVSGAGDVNDDDFDDVLICFPFSDIGGSEAGVARVYSGASGALLHEWTGDSPGDQLGFAAAAAGDVNNDGYADLIIGAPFDDNNGFESGSARVFSGLTGAILYTLSGDTTNIFAGWSVGGAGDVNGDGFDDLIVGAPYDRINGLVSGSVHVFSGATGTVLMTFQGHPGDNFGASVSGVGDVNADGRADFIISSVWDDRGGNNAGSARVYYSVPTAPAPPTCPGDLNADNMVDIDDLNQVLANWNTRCQ